MTKARSAVAASLFLFCSAIGTAAAGELLVQETPGLAVSSAHPLATQAGIEILESGGNAFDAAVAIAAALAVVEPQGSGLGGGGFFLVHRPSDKLSVFVDARETAPGAATGDIYLDRNGRPRPALSRDGPLAAAIPGTAAGLEHMTRMFGRKTLKDNLAPAIRYARNGFAVDEAFATALAESSHRLSPAAQAVFLRRGEPLSAGDRLVQPDLARTLQAMADRGARDGFYTGDVGQKLRAGVFSDGGIWSSDDLRTYRVKEREPLVFNYRGHRITTAPLPSAGGVTMAQILGMLDARAWPPEGEAAARHDLIEAMRLAYRDRTVYLGDSDFVRVPEQRLLSGEYLATLGKAIRSKATPSESLELDGLQQARAKGDQTTHFSVIDQDGNRVAATLSLNTWFGSGYMPPGTGVLLNNQMDDFATAPLVPNSRGFIQTEANSIQPHKRPLSSMTPTFVDGPRGVFITGTPGGTRIVTAVLLSVLGHTNGLDVTQVVTAPRFHHQFRPDYVQFEDDALTQEQQQALQERGHRLVPFSAPVGNMQAIHWDVAAHTLQAASDPRGSGASVVRLKPRRY